jgi:hypothetical protein
VGKEEKKLEGFWEERCVVEGKKKVRGEKKNCDRMLFTGPPC